VIWISSSSSIGGIREVSSNENITLHDVVISTSLPCVVSSVYLSDYNVNLSLFHREGRLRYPTVPAHSGE